MTIVGTATQGYLHPDGGSRGVCAGTIASAGVGIPCPGEHGGHLLVGHWLAVPLLALFGALIGRRVPSP